MRIPRIHIDHGLAEGEIVALGDAQSHYLKHVLRLKPGAAVRLFDGRESVDHAARIEYDGKTVLASVEGKLPAAGESPLPSQVMQGLARPDHVDWMLQKTTELGVQRVLLFNAARTQTPLRGARLERKLAHWHGVAISACEQCGRARLPQIEFQPGLQAALGAAIPGQRILLDTAGATLRSLLEPPATGVAILLGPEGGLDAAEIEIARAAGFTPASLGPRVLRTETAAVAALTIVQSVLGDM